MSCKEVREELAALLDRELEEGVERRVRAHLEVCAECREEVGAMEKTRAAVASTLSQRPSSPGSFEALWSAIESPRSAVRRPRASRAGGSGRASRRSGRRATFTALAAAGIAAFGLYLVLEQSQPIEPDALVPVAVAPPASDSAGVLVAGRAGAPDELRQRPDMFVDFVIVRRLDKLDRLPELLRYESRDGGALERT